MAVSFEEMTEIGIKELLYLYLEHQEKQKKKLNQEKDDELKTKMKRA